MLHTGELNLSAIMPNIERRLSSEAVGHMFNAFKQTNRGEWCANCNVTR